MRRRWLPSYAWLLAAGLFSGCSCGIESVASDGGQHGGAHDAGSRSDAGSLEDAGTLQDAGGDVDGGHALDAGDDLDGGVGADAGDDDEVPSVVSALPVYGATEVPVLTLIEVSFSRPMDQALTVAAFSMESESGALVAGTFTWHDEDRLLRFAPSAALLPDTTYVFAIDVGAAGQNGVPLDEPFESYFTTVDGDVTLDATWDDFTWDESLWQ